MENKNIAKLGFPRKEKRNRLMIEDYQRMDERGEYVMSTKEICMKYEIRKSRVYALLKLYGVPTRQAALKNK